MSAQLELGFALAQPADGLTIGDRVLVPETPDGERVPEGAVSLGTVVATRRRGCMRSALVHFDGTELLKGFPERHLRPAGGRLAPALLEHLLAEIRAAWAEHAAEQPVWHRGPYPSPEALAEVRDGFTHMIRATDDPGRQTREARRARLGGVEAASGEVMRSRKTRTPEAALVEVRALLADGKPRTLNAIGVELWDQTADMVDDRIWHAIVDAVAAGEMEHTIRAPILIRLRVEKSG
jgi:hypothetical protein